MKTTMSRQPNRRAVLARAAGLAAAACTPWAATASDQIPPPAQQGALVLKNAVLHTITDGDIDGGSLLIEQGRIRAIARAGQALPAASGAVRTVDLQGRHVYPGFISAHTALGLVEVEAVRATIDSTETGVVNPNARALVALNADSELLPVARSNGVLAALAVPGGSRFGSIAGTSALIQLDGWNWEDLALQREAGLHITLPSMRLSAEVLSGELEAFRDDIRNATQTRLKLIERAFEQASAYGQAKAADPRHPTDLRWEAMLPVLKGQRAVFVQANELPQIRWALALAERWSLKLVIVGGADAPRLAPVLKARGVPVVIGGVHELPIRRDDAYDARYTLAAELAQAGVPFCIARNGGNFAAAHERNLPYEAATAAAYGLPREEALKAITLYPAQILGVADRLGSIGVGKLASLIVTDGDPLETPTRILQLYVQGREVDPSNRQQRLERKYRQRLGQNPAQG